MVYWCRFMCVWDFCYENAHDGSMYSMAVWNRILAFGSCRYEDAKMIG